MDKHSLCSGNAVASLQNSFVIKDPKYTVKVAQSDSEIDQALKLRFEIFNLELGEGLQESFQTLRDEDPYDKQCHHLIITDNKSNEIVGTYRMQNFETASEGIGFYSENEFKLAMLPKEVLQNSVELGRACIAKEFRNKKVLFLLWCGIARYLSFIGKRYFFGCCSLTSQDENEGVYLWQSLMQDKYTHTSLLVDTQDPFKISIKNTAALESKSPDYPPLLAMYLRYGAKVISPPAIDREFKTIDYLVLLDTFDLPLSVKTMFFSERN